MSYSIPYPLALLSSYNVDRKGPKFEKKLNNMGLL